MKQSLLRLGTMVLVLAVVPGLVLAATLSGNTDLNGGPPIPTDVGSFDETDNAYPYIYNIDDTPGDVGLQNRVALDMAGFNLNNTGDGNHDVTINAASVSYTGGGDFNFGGCGSRPSLTINATGAISVFRFRANGGTSGANSAGSVTFSAPGGITVGNNLEQRHHRTMGATVGAISLTSTGGSGSIQIGGGIYTHASNSGSSNGGSVTLNAASGIGVTGSISTYTSAGNRNAGNITMIGGTGSVSIGGTINANAASGGTRIGDMISRCMQSINKIADFIT